MDNRHLHFEWNRENTSTRQIHQSFNHEVSKFWGITIQKYFLCNMYTELTGMPHIINKEIDKHYLGLILGTLIGHWIGHLSKCILLRYLIEQVAKDCLVRTTISSKTAALLAFAPKNVYIKTTKLYNSRFQLEFKTQPRELWTSHIDDCYCAAQFCYMQEYLWHLRILQNLALHN